MRITNRAGSRWAAGLAALVLLGTLATRVHANTVVVDPGHPGVWQWVNYDFENTPFLRFYPTTSGTQFSFGVGPGSPPLGVGSERQRIGTDTGDGTAIWTRVMDGQPLSALATLKYSTWCVNSGTNKLAPFCNISVDWDGDGVADDFLTFEPRYQDGATAGDAVPVQPAVANGTWQEWNAAVGGFVVFSVNFAGPPIYTLAHYMALHPGATFSRDAVQPSIQFLTGVNGDSQWSGFDGSVDKLVINGTQYDLEPGDAVEPMTNWLCLTPATPCVNVPVVFTRTDATPARGVSVTFQLSSNLQLCDPAHPANSIHQDGWLAAFPSNTFQIIDNGGGSYTVDQAILGMPCGETRSGAVFNIDVQKAPSAPDGSGTITVTAVDARDCSNGPVPGVPGAPASLPIQFTAPAAIAALAATPQQTGNPAGQVTNITVSWPAQPAGDEVQLFRKGFGHYPDYDDQGGATPATPATPGAAASAGWTAVGGGFLSPTSSTVDLPATRDFYYYVAFVTDGCGNVSAVSNQTNGTLNYHLGDVSNGFAACTGDNVVNTADISLLGANYGATISVGGALECLDVGPTTTSTVNGRPTTDHKIQFEDLILFAINFGTVSRPQAAVKTVSAGADEVTVDAPATVTAGATFAAEVRMKGAGTLQGLSAQLGWDPAVVEPLAVEPGSFVTDQNGVVMSAQPGNVDAALLGVRGQGLSGEGVVARVQFRALASGKPAVRLAKLEARDPANRPVAILGSTDRPKETALMPVAPNPSRGAPTVSFALARAGNVDLGVFGVDGRRVSTLVHETREPGVFRIAWNGLDAGGNPVRPGLYFVRLQTPEGRFTRTMVIVR